LRLAVALRKKEKQLQVTVISRLNYSLTRAFEGIIWQKSSVFLVVKPVLVRSALPLDSPPGRITALAKLRLLRFQS